MNDNNCMYVGFMALAIFTGMELYAAHKQDVAHRVGINDRMMFIINPELQDAMD